jgi:F-type H+-transporting ATPase subunit b
MRLPLPCRPLAIAAFAALVVAAPASAAKEDDKHDHKKPELYVKHGDQYDRATDADVKAAAGVHDDHGSGGGLGFTGIKRWDLGIYTLIVFALLILILSKFAWPHIKEGLEKREANIRSALDEARREREQSLVALAEAKKQLAAAADQVKGMLDEARRDADVLKASEREVGVKDAAAERDRAKREIEAARDAALKDIYEQAVKLAALMSEKALRRSVSAEDHRRLLDESIAELKGSNGKA